MIRVILFTKAGCSLCDEVKHHLERLQNDFPHQLQEIDITQDNQLYETYRYTIPVVQIGKEELPAPISLQQLQHVLKTASDLL